MKHPFVFSFTIVFLTVALSTLNAKAQTIPIESKENAIVLQVSAEKHLDMVYFGSKLSDKNEYAAIAKTYRPRT